MLLSRGGSSYGAVMGAHAVEAIPGLRLPLRVCSSRFDCCFGADARLVVEFVDYVSVPAEREPSIVAELPGDVDHATPLVQEQGGEGVAERVRRSAHHVRGDARTSERASAPRLVGGERPWLAVVAGEDERAPGRVATPAGEVLPKRRKESDGPVVAGLRVVGLSERQRPLYQQSVFSRTSRQFNARASLGRRPA